MVCSSRFALCLMRPASTRHRQQPLALNVVPPTIQRPREFFCAGAALRLSGSRPYTTNNLRALEDRLELLRNATQALGSGSRRSRASHRKSKCKIRTQVTHAA